VIIAGKFRQLDSDAITAGLAAPAVLGGVPPRMDPVPAPGEHTAQILAELGYA
jgi:itaconate CoA-transferase